MLSPFTFCQSAERCVPQGEVPGGGPSSRDGCQGVIPRGTVAQSAGRTVPRSPNPLQAPRHRPLQSQFSDTCNGFLRSGLKRSYSPLLGRPRLPPGVVTSSRPPRAPGLARPRHPAASSEKSGAELAPRLARGDSAAWAPGPGNRDKQAGRRGGGGRAGAWPRAGHPGSGARRRPRREREGSAAALEPGYRARQAARGRAGYGAGGLRGRRWWQGPVHGGLSAESPSGAVRLVTQKEISDLSADQKPTSCLKAQVAVCHGKLGAANGDPQ